MFFSNVNQNFYKTFIEIYKTKNVSHAAKRLCVSQSTASQNIKELEGQLGIKLFNRTTRNVNPTDTADEFFKNIEPLIVQLNKHEQDIKEFNGKSKTIIKIACATNFAELILAGCIHEFKKQNTDTKFDIIKIKPDEAVDMLKNKSFDLTFSTLEVDVKGKYEKTTLLDFTETYFSSQTYAEQNNLQPIITKEKFDELQLITLRPQETRKNTIHMVDTQSMLFQMINKNLGVGHCIEQFLNLNYPNQPIFKFVIEGKEMPKKSFDCIYNKNLLTKAAKLFLDRIKVYLCQTEI